jgi:hypothetical protein
MHPVRSFNQVPLFARALLVVVALAGVLMLALPAPVRGRRARSAAAARPPAAPLVTAPRPNAGPLLLTSLTVGPEPRLFQPGRRVVTTFITDDGESCHLVAAARLAGSTSAVIHWSVVAPVGFILPVDGRWTGPGLDVVLRRPGGNPGGLGGPLSLTVQARADVNGQECVAGESVTQDELDQLRQEYVDLARRAVPDRSEFMDAAAFAARYGSRYPWLHFEDLNWSVNGNTQARYSYAIIRPELVEGLDRVRRAYRGIVINSGYRNPVHQIEVNAPVRESLHQYGCAADLAVLPGPGRGLPNEVDWRRLAEAACSAQAKWVEPLASSGPNSPGCHVHVDYRPGPVSSAPVRLHGQVVAAATGRPVVGALVLLGGMPARTDSSGVFGIRNVLSGGLHPVEVRADGFDILNQPVPLVAWGTAYVRLALRPPSHRELTVEVARTYWVDRKARVLSAILRVSSTAGGELRDVRLSPAPGPGVQVDQEQLSLAMLPARAVRGVAVLLRLRPGQVTASMPLALGVIYHGASGAEERTQLALSVLLPGALPPSSALRVVKQPPAARPSPAPPAAARTSVVASPVTTVRPTSSSSSLPPAPIASPLKSPVPPVDTHDLKPALGLNASGPEPSKSSAPKTHAPEPAPPAAHETGSTEPKPEKAAPTPAPVPSPSAGEAKPASPGEAKPAQPNAAQDAGD